MKELYFQGASGSPGKAFKHHNERGPWSHHQNKICSSQFWGFQPKQIIVKSGGKLRKTRENTNCSPKTQHFFRGGERQWRSQPLAAPATRAPPANCPSPQPPPLAITPVSLQGGVTSPGTSAVLITKRGVARRRYWNFVSKEWRWDAERLSLSENEDGRLGYHIDWWTSLHRCIALAWRKGHPQSTNHLVVDETKPPHVNNIAWQRGDDSERPIRGETWKPLAWTIGPIRCNAQYKISSHGRLLSPQGEVTEGFFFYDRRFAATEEGLVDLTTAARLRPNVVHLPPRIRMAYDALNSGHSPNVLARAAGVEVKTAWSYFAQAAVHVSNQTLRRFAPGLVSRDLWSVLMSMKAARDSALGGPLAELMDRVLGVHLSHRGEFHKSKFQFGELRFARVCMA